MIQLNKLRKKKEDLHDYSNVANKMTIWRWSAEQQSHYVVASHSFTPSPVYPFIHSFIPAFIHIPVLSLPAVVYWVEPETQAAGNWVISAFLSRLSTPHESPHLQEKETQVKFAFMSPCLLRAHAGVFARWGLAGTRTWAATAVTFRGWEQTSALHLQLGTASLLKESVHMVWIQWVLLWIPCSLVLSWVCGCDTHDDSYFWNDRMTCKFDNFSVYEWDPSSMLACSLVSSDECNWSLRTIHSLIHSFSISAFSCTLEVILAMSGQRQGFTMHHHLPASRKDKQPFTPAPSDNLEFPICLTCIFWNCGIRSENPERTQNVGRHSENIQQLHKGRPLTHNHLCYLHLLLIRASHI